MNAKKVLLIGTQDHEDGGYMSPKCYVIPSNLMYYSDIIDWFKLQQDYVRSLVEEDIDYVNEEAQNLFEDENVKFSFKDVEDVSFEDGVLSLSFESGGYDFEYKYSIDTMKLYEQGE
jgi:hypothetical protein